MAATTCATCSTTTTATRCWPSPRTTAGLTNVDRWVARRARRAAADGRDDPVPADARVRQRVLEAQKAYRATYARQLGMLGTASWPLGPARDGRWVQLPSGWRFASPCRGEHLGTSAAGARGHRLLCAVRPTSAIASSHCPWGCDAPRRCRRRGPRQAAMPAWASLQRASRASRSGHGPADGTDTPQMPDSTRSVFTPAADQPKAIESLARASSRASASRRCSARRARARR